MRLLILGGTGFAGQALIDHLRRASPAVEMAVVSRTATQLPGVGRVIAGHYADLAASPDFRRELATFAAVVHLADGLSVLQKRPYAGDTAEADRLVENSERLVLAVRDAQVPLFVHVSSIKALCDEEDDRVLVETSAPRSTTLYGLGKLRLEQVVAAALAGSATGHVIVRNPVMYGTGKGGSLLRLLQLADTAYPLPLGGLTNKRSILSVRNLASALSAIVHAGRGDVSGVFHVHDGPALSTTEIVATLRRALGRPRRLFPIGPLADLARQVLLLAPVARRLYGSLELSDALFRRHFHWTPVTDTETGLAAMAEAFAAARRGGRRTPIHRDA